MNNNSKPIYVAADKSINSRGRTEWRLPNGRLHREPRTGPTIEYDDGSKEWYVDGKRYRKDGPAVDWVNGHKEWYEQGKLHRVNGPAIIHSNGTKEWWIRGEKSTVICSHCGQNMPGEEALHVSALDNATTARLAPNRALCASALKKLTAEEQTALGL